MVTLSPEAGQGSEPGVLLKRHPVGAPLALPHAVETMGRVGAAPPGDRESCEAQQETPERMKRCSDSTGRRMQEADKVQSYVYFREHVCTGMHAMYNLISLLFCLLRELPGLLTSARGGSPSRAWQSSLAEGPQYSTPGICQPGNQRRGAPTAAAATCHLPRQQQGL